MGIEGGELATHDSGILAKPPEERLRLALEELGPTFIKFGQIMSSRRDLVNGDYSTELCKLQDSVPTFPGQEAKRIFAEEIGMSVAAAFKDFDETPLAGASIAQVHRATTKEGAVVAVKIQRPDIQPLIERDLSILLNLATLVEKHVPGKDYRLVVVDGQVLGVLERSPGGVVGNGRDTVEALLQQRYGVRLLAVYVYPAQVMFCNRPFAGLFDLAGRTVRVSSVGQSELVAGLGAKPIVTPFAEIVPAVRAGVVECALTGTLSGNAIGLHEVTTHVSRVGISWGVSIFAANERAWQALPADIRAALEAGLAGLQAEIWAAAEQETEAGLACNAGRPDCAGGTRGRMTIVEDRPQDQQRRNRLLTDVVLPAWVQRCGSECAEVWNAIMGPARGILAKVD
jgi:hypothetical protein